MLNCLLEQANKLAFPPSNAYRAKCQICAAVPDVFYSKLTLCKMTGAGPVSCRNYQEIKIQEQVQRLSVGSIPRSMWVILEDDLVDCCKAGDDVTIW